jgi:hypothetical protein
MRLVEHRCGVRSCLEKPIQNGWKWSKILGDQQIVPVPEYNEVGVQSKLVETILREG